MLLCQPVEQMRSRVYVSEVCVHTHPEGGECTVGADRNTFDLLSPVCLTSGEVPAA